MKIFFTTIVLLFLSFNLSAQEWEVYKNESLQIRANFPDTPEKTVQKVDTAVGTLDMHMVMYAPESGDDNAVYSIIRSDYPEEQFKDADDEYNSNVLDGAVNGAVSNVQGTLIFDKKVNFNGFPSRNIKIEMSGGYIYINAILVYNSMYITQVICLQENDNNPSIKRFQDSFDIIEVNN